MIEVKLVAVFAENKLGQMARITKVLADAGVNIRWMTIATTETFGVIKFLVDQRGRGLIGGKFYHQDKQHTHYYQLVVYSNKRDVKQHTD